MFQLEFFGDFFPEGDPRRNWACNGEEDETLEAALKHYENNVAQNKIRGYSIPPNRIKNLETGEIVWTNGVSEPKIMPLPEPPKKLVIEELIKMEEIAKEL